MSNKFNTAAQIIEQDPRWQAVAKRDSAFDDTFFYSVKSTGVYCRPSCAARLAKPENVSFHDSAAAAERAGFRPCKRCKPHEPRLAKQNAEKIAQVCRVIEASDEIPSLSELAKEAGLSDYHFHRLFKAVTGVTPRAYAVANRAKRVRDELSRKDNTVTQAIYEAGYHSGGRFYDTSNEVLGMTPTDYRDGGANTQIHFAVGECSLGSILVAKSEKGVCAILLGDEPDALVRDLQDRFPKADLVGGDKGFEKLIARVVGYIEKPSLGIDLPLDVRGTAFQQRVWQALREVPPGSTASYSDIAKKIGEPKAVRAVASACGANPIAFVIPCHRILRSDGSLSGYRWGIDRKRALLKREAAA